MSHGAATAAPGHAGVAAGALVPRERRAGAQELPSVLSTTPTVLGLLLAARRRWRLALFLGLTAASLTAAGMWFSQRERYIARTMVHISDSGVLTQPVQDRNDQRTQIAYAKSRLVLNKALRDVKVAELKVVKDEIDPLLWLEKEIYADFSIAPQIFRIYMVGENPQELLPIVNAVREAYLDEVRRLENDSKQQRVGKLGEIFEEMNSKLQEKKRLLKQLSEDLGSTKDPKVQERAQELYWKSFDALHAELVQMHSKLRQAQMELAVEQAKDPKSGEVKISNDAVEKAIKDAPEIQGRTKHLAKLDYDLSELRKRFFEPEKESKVKEAVAAREAFHKDLEAEKEKLRQEFQQHMRKNLEGSKAAREQNILILEKQVKWLDEEVNKRLQSFQKLNKQRVDVEWLQEEIKLQDELARKVSLQKQLLDVEMKAPDRYRVMEEAFCVPDTDTRIKKAGLAGGGAFAFIVFAIALLEFRSRRVGSVDDVVRGLRMRLVGALPNMPARARQQGAAKRTRDVRWQHQMAESVESARTMILHAAQTESLHVIAVTSAVGGEGKTMTCSHLAASLARSGRKTLLIDADLRRPALQKLFNVAPQPGFSELLRGEVDAAAAIQATPVHGLSILAAGNGDDRAVQALSQPILSELLKRLREQYDFVIIDTAPVLPVADSQMICQQADGVIFAVLRDVSRLPQIYAAHERLQSLRVRVLGAVVNGASGPGYGSSYVYSRKPGQA